MFGASIQAQVQCSFGGELVEPAFDLAADTQPQQKPSEAAGQSEFVSVPCADRRFDFGAVFLADASPTIGDDPVWLLL